MAEKILIRSMYNSEVEKAVGNPTGTRYDKLYRIEYSKTGHRMILPNGETDRYAKIQSHAEECKIENIIAKSKLDPTVLNQKQGVYGDFTKMPKSLAEAQNMIIGIKQEFFQLPVEVREKFNNSPEQYVAQYGSKKWLEDTGMATYLKAKELKEERKEAKEENAEQ